MAATALELVFLSLVFPVILQQSKCYLNANLVSKLENKLQEIRTWVFLSHLYIPSDLYIDPFIQQTFIEYLLCTNQYSKHWKFSIKQDRQGLCPQGSYISVKEDKPKQTKAKK